MLCYRKHKRQNQTKLPPSKIEIDLLRLAPLSTSLYFCINNTCVHTLLHSAPLHFFNIPKIFWKINCVFWSKKIEKFLPSSAELFHSWEGLLNLLAGKGLGLCCTSLGTKCHPKLKTVSIFSILVKALIFLSGKEPFH